MTELSLGEFTNDERALLLRLAHESILSALENREIALDPPSARFAEPRGAFTSLYLRGALRGCVGYVLPVSPVYRAVADTAPFDDHHASAEYRRTVGTRIFASTLRDALKIRELA